MASSPHTDSNASTDRSKFDSLIDLTKWNNEATTIKKLDELSTDMGDLLQEGMFSDVVVTDGTDEIRAHKSILSIRSPVFDRMLQHPMKENTENRILIKDMPIESLKKFLHFMYTGTIVVKNDLVSALDVYEAADKYDVKDLYRICSGMLGSVINLDNVFYFLGLADQHNDENIKDASLCFIFENYSQLKSMVVWNTFIKEHQSLAIEVLTFVLDKCEGTVSSQRRSKTN